jgi:hypothetical protein
VIEWEVSLVRCGAIATIAFFTLCGSSVAAPLDGNGYLELCTASDIGLQNGCAGYGAGILTALGFWNGITVEQGGPAAKFCVPSGVSIEQASDVMLSYVRDHPEQRHQLAGMLGFFALSEAFPC